MGSTVEMMTAEQRAGMWKICAGESPAAKMADTWRGVATFHASAVEVCASNDIATAASNGSAMALLIRAREEFITRWSQESRLVLGQGGVSCERMFAIDSAEADHRDVTADRSTRMSAEMSVVTGGSGVDMRRGREEAALAIVEGYEHALMRLHPRDVEECRYYRERLRDARLAAGLAPVMLAPPAGAQPPD